MRAASWPRPFESRSKNHGIVRNRLAQASRTSEGGKGCTRSKTALIRRSRRSAFLSWAGSATYRRAPTWLHHAVDQARLPQISLGITHRRGPKPLRWGRLSQTAEALD